MDNAYKKTIVLEQIKEIFALNPININEKVNKIFASGCIDSDSVKEDDYRTAKNIVIAILEDAAEKFKPLPSPIKNRKEINNIKIHL